MSSGNPDSLPRSTRRPGASLVALVFLVLAGCSGSSDSPTPAPDPAAPGPYPVGVTRIEIYDADRDRTMLTQVWYPAAESARDQAPASHASFLPPDLSFLADNVSFEIVGVRDAEIAPDGPWPLILFSHGSGGIRFQNSYECEHLASHGYVVVAPDHQGNTYFDASGEQAQLAVDRPLDLLYVLDEMTRLNSQDDSRFAGWIDFERPVGASGMSFGAFTIVVAAGMDDRIQAVLPQVWTGPLSEDFDAATMLMIASEDKTTGLAGNAAMRETYENAPGPRIEIEVPDAGHFSFSFSCHLGLGIGDGDGCGTGVRHADGSSFEFIEAKTVWELTKVYGAAFFGRYIKGIESYETVLATNLFPEIATHKSDLD